MFVLGLVVGLIILLAGAFMGGFIQFRTSWPWK